LVLTSFSPIFLTYSFILYMRGESLLKIVILLGIIILLLITCVLIIELSRRKLEVVRFPINSVKIADGEVVGFLVAYLFPFTSLTTDKVNEITLLFVLFIFFVVIFGTNAYHFNPLLSLLGYHFYEVTTESNVTYLLITKKTLKNTVSINEVAHLTDYIVLDVSN